MAPTRFQSRVDCLDRDIRSTAALTATTKTCLCGSGSSEDSP
jgi:hypothetical protein